MESKHAQQELALIAEMIQSARKEFNERGTIFLMWGWLVTIAAIGQYILIHLHFENNSLPWLLMPVGAIGQFIIMRRRDLNEQAKTHVGKIIGRLWVAIAIGIGLTLVMMSFLGKNTYPVLMILYATGTFTTGHAINLRPLVYGALCCWAIAAVSFFMSFEIQLLLLALAMIISYIIPGYAMNLRYKKANS